LVSGIRDAGAATRDNKIATDAECEGRLGTAGLTRTGSDAFQTEARTSTAGADRDPVIYSSR
jgi:hypothetical protein